METKERGWGEKEATHHLSLPKPLSTFQMEGCVVSLMGGVDHRGPQLHVPLRWRTFVSNSAVQVHFIPSILLTSFVSLYVFISNQAGGPSTACTGREVSKSSGFYKGCEFGRTGNPRWEQGMWQHSISDIILQYGKVEVACKIQVETWTVSNFSNKLSCLKY